MVIPKDFLTMENIGELGELLINQYNFNRSITMSQLRKFLSHVNFLQNKYEADNADFNRNDIDYLRIKLAYQTGRYKNLQPLYNELDPVMKSIKNTEEFSRFARLMESLIAYHKFHGGKD